MRSTNVQKRLARVEGLVGDISCNHCRSWNGIALVDDEGHPDRSANCPVCGRVVPVNEPRCFVGIGLDVP